MIAALDLSLTHTGYCFLGDEMYCGSIVPPAKMRGHERLDYILARLDEILSGSEDVWLEGFAFHARGRAVFDIAGLGWVVRQHLHERGIGYHEVSPASIKRYGAGKGTANKTAMVIAARERFGYTGTDDNEADAVILAHFAAEARGAPRVTVPKLHREAVEAWKP